MTKAKLIAIEGIDGSGKSTQMKLLTEKLRAAGVKVHQTSEPTNGRIGTIIRDIFNHRMESDHRVIAGLFVADRLSHLLDKTHGIIKKIEEGFTVVCDRYYFSSYAYQGTHMPLKWVIEANSLSAELLRPDLNIFIDVPPDICMKRLTGNRSSIEMYETLDNLKKVREKYFEAFDLLKDKEKILIIDGNREPDTVFSEIWNKLDFGGR
jgi:dTMP kinase